MEARFGEGRGPYLKMVEAKTKGKISLGEKKGQFAQAMFMDVWLSSRKGEVNVMLDRSC